MDVPALEEITAIGQRVHIMGSSCSGKSTLGERLARIQDVPYVDLDALNWEPNWVSLAATDPTEFERRISKATEGNAWIVSGSYTKFSQRLFWPQLETIIWLDLPLTTLIRRVIRRSWHRWRTKELLWGTNYEQFWPQLAIWKKEESLVWWIVSQYYRKRRSMLGYMADPRWRHIRFIRLTSSREIELFASMIERAYTNKNVAT